MCFGGLSGLEATFLDDQSSWSRTIPLIVSHRELGSKRWTTTTRWQRWRSHCAQSPITLRREANAKTSTPTSNTPEARLRQGWQEVAHRQNPFHRDI
ncbi:hypothetical protein PHBOTO_000312 [Pseudozyma hubeiensis]|nr:hypothetical protein PHBOTO_000312 [Pseudozyma hubeiensis]